MLNSEDLHCFDGIFSKRDLARGSVSDWAAGCCGQRTHAPPQRDCFCAANSGLLVKTMAYGRFLLVGFPCQRFVTTSNSSRTVWMHWWMSFEHLATRNTTSVRLLARKYRDTCIIILRVSFLPDFSNMLRKSALQRIAEADEHEVVAAPWGFLPQMTLHQFALIFVPLPWDYLSVDLNVLLTMCFAHGMWLAWWFS